MGIAIDAPKYSSMNSEDFILLQCENWSEKEKAFYEEANEELQFFQTDALKCHRMRVTEFPKAPPAETAAEDRPKPAMPMWFRQEVQTLSRSHGLRLISLAITQMRV